MHVQQTILEGSGSRMLQLTPSVPHLVLHYPVPIKVPCSTKELMIPFVLWWGTEPKQMTTTNPSNLAAVSTSAVFCQPTRGLKCTYCTLQPPPKQQATVGLTIPSAAREDLINDWSELLCHRWGRSPPTVSYIILTALLFSCLLSIQRPVIGVMLCTG